MGRRSQRKQRTFRSQPSAPAGTKRPTRRASAKSGGPLRRLVALAAVVGLTALLVWLFVDGMFYVSNADITGLRYSSASEVYRQAGIDGYNILWVNGRDVAGRLEALPYIKDATVRTSLPNRVRIAVEERMPVAVWKVGGRDFWVDLEGITMPVASQVDDLPVLWDLDGSTVVADGRVDRELIAAIRALKLQQPNVFRVWLRSHQRPAVSDAHGNDGVLGQTGWARPAGRRVGCAATEPGERRAFTGGDQLAR